MLSTETINAAERIIERFGFPIFVALISLVFLAAIVRYFIKTIQKQDCDFLSYAEKRDTQISTIVAAHNDVNLKTVEAVNGLKNSIDLRIHRELRKERKEKGDDGVTLG